MSKKRVLCNFMHEDEARACQQWIDNAVTTESYVVGEIEEENIALLEAQGLIVQELKAPAPPETPGIRSKLGPRTIEKEKPSLLLDAEPEIAQPSIDEAKPNYYLVQLSGPLLEPWREELKSHGVELLEYIPQNAYTAKLSPDQARAVQSMSFVSLVRVYQEIDTAPEALVLSAEETTHAPTPPPLSTPKAMKVYDLRLHQAEDLQALLDQLQMLGVSVAGASGRKVRVYLLEDDPRAMDITGMMEVASMEEYVPRQTALPKPQMETAIGLAIPDISQPSPC